MNEEGLLITNNKNKRPCGRLRKIIFNNSVHFITCSVNQGIMLPANSTVKYLIKAAIAKAQIYHPVVVSHFLVNGTHLHIIVRVDNPEDIPGFMERFKTESAHFLNRLLGRNKANIWNKSYDAPRLLDLEAVVSRIVYLYTNPVKDGLIDSINNYPGLSSWNIYQGRQKKLLGKLLARSKVIAINQSQGFRYFKKISKLLSENKGALRKLDINPDDWFRSFGIEDAEEIAEINQKIVSRIKEEESELQQEREKEGKSFLGRELLANQGIDLSYQRQDLRGKKMWCISSDRDKRKRYISFLKTLVAEARAVYGQWCLGNTSLRMPPGVFSPRMPVVENIYSAAIGY